MNKTIQELINKAEPYTTGTPLTSILVIPSGESFIALGYTAIRYQHMILIGEDTRTKKVYYINPNHPLDAMVLYHFTAIHAVDIPYEYGGAVRLLFDQLIYIDTENMVYSATPFPIKEENTQC